MRTTPVTTSVQHRSLQLPPRYDLWPVALQHAMKLRGALLPCGPGLRGIGWPDSPTVRLSALAPWLERNAVACGLTAAWVWGAARSPGPPLQFAVGTGRRTPVDLSGAAQWHELQFGEADRVRLGRFEVASRERTALDLLYSTNGFGIAETVACRLLLASLPEGDEKRLESLLRRRRPHGRVARERFRRISGAQTIGAA